MERCPTIFLWISLVYLIRPQVGDALNALKVSLNLTSTVVFTGFSPDSLNIPKGSPLTVTEMFEKDSRPSLEG